MAADVVDVFWHAGVLAHDAGRGVFERPPSPLMAIDEPHPDTAERVRNMHALLARGPLAKHLRWHVGRLAEPDELLAFHTAGYIEQVQALERSGGGYISPTTAVAPGTFDACRAAAGTALAAVAHALAGDGAIAYALVRPPGHHAGPAQADGYCIVNNVALAAQLARLSGARRVAVIDWDVHHGNGTQDGFDERDDILTVSLHMDHGAWGPTHPQTGRADEVGRGRGRGFNLNVALPMGTGDAGYARAMEALVVPVVDHFAPEMIVIAAGQDASQFDPNGRQLLTMAGFRRLGAFARALAERHTGGRLCLVQEGGYAVSYAAFCLHATLEGVLGVGPLLDDPLAYLPEATAPADAAIEAIGETRAAALA